MAKAKKRLGVLTGGGDCPGLNAVIRAVVKTAENDYNAEVIGFLDGYEGLVENRFRPLDIKDVPGLLTQGGTILGTSNRADPFNFPVLQGDEYVHLDRSNQTIFNFESLGLDVLIAIGGDGTAADRLKALLGATLSSVVVDDNDPDPSATAFETDLNMSSDGINNAFCVFTSGALTGQSQRVSDWDNATKVLTVASAYTAAPAAGDAFLIIGKSA